MASFAYRLRKKCAENVHFINKGRNSYSYNYFTLTLPLPRKSPKTGLHAIFVAERVVLDG